MIATQFTERLRSQQALCFFFILSGTNATGGSVAMLGNI